MRKNVWTRITALLTALGMTLFCACDLDSLVGDLSDLIPEFPPIGGGENTDDGQSPTPDTGDTTEPDTGDGGEDGGESGDADDTTGGENVDDGDNGNENDAQPDTPDEPDTPVAPLPTPDDTTSGEVAPLPIAPDFTPVPVTQKYGYKYFAEMENGEDLCGFYYDLYNAATTFHRSTRNVASQTVSLNGAPTQIYVVDELDYSTHSLSSAQAVAVWKTFRAEYPEFYWIENTVTYTSRTMNLHIFDDYVSYSVRADIQEDIENVATDARRYLTPEMGEAERALTLYDYLSVSMTYAEDGNGVPSNEVWAHNLVGAMQRYQGVCESYAKAYNYLCTLYGVESLFVEGRADSYNAGNSYDAQGHAWNYIRVGENWYPVDVTWGDNTTIHREWFAPKAVDFNLSHWATLPTDRFGNEWQYGLPQLATYGLSPTVLYENNAEQGTFYPFIDSAFSAMTNGGSAYTIEVLPHTSVSSAMNMDLATNGYTFSTSALPSVRKITVKGKAFGKGMVDLTATNELTLSCELRLKGIKLHVPRLSPANLVGKDWSTVVYV